MKWFLIFAAIHADGFQPRGEVFDSQAACEKVRAAAAREVAKAPPGAQYILACLRVRSSDEKDV